MTEPRPDDIECALQCNGGSLEANARTIAAHVGKRLDMDRRDRISIAEGLRAQIASLENELNKLRDATKHSS